MRARLKQETAVAHQWVDNAFSQLDLTDRGSYGFFLQTHDLAFRSLLGALPPDHWISEVLQDVTAALAADLSRLGLGSADDSNVAPIWPTGT